MPSHRNRFGASLYHRLMVLVAIGWMGVTGNVATVLASPIITNVSVSRPVGVQHAAPVIVPGGLAEGVVPYVDRPASWAWRGVPDILSGADYIMTANDDKFIHGGEYAVTIGRNAMLYVFVDQRLDDPLPWLTDGSAGTTFMLTDRLIQLDPLIAGQPLLPFDIWQSSVGPGTYMLGNQFDPTTGQYGIAAIPEPSTLVLLGLGGALLFRRRRQGHRCAMVTCLQVQGAER